MITHLKRTTILRLLLITILLFAPAKTACYLHAQRLKLGFSSAKKIGLITPAIAGGAAIASAIGFCAAACSEQATECIHQIANYLPSLPGQHILEEKSSTSVNFTRYPCLIISARAGIAIIGTDIEQKSIFKNISKKRYLSWAKSKKNFITTKIESSKPGNPFISATATMKVSKKAPKKPQKQEVSKKQLPYPFNFLETCHNFRSIIKLGVLCTSLKAIPWIKPISKEMLEIIHESYQLVQEIGFAENINKDAFKVIIETLEILDHFELNYKNLTISKACLEGLITIFTQNLNKFEDSCKSKQKYLNICICLVQHSQQSIKKIQSSLQHQEQVNNTKSIEKILRSTTPPSTSDITTLLYRDVKEVTEKNDALLRKLYRAILSLNFFDAINQNTIQQLINTLDTLATFNSPKTPERTITFELLQGVLNLPPDMDTLATIEKELKEKNTELYKIIFFMKYHLTNSRTNALEKYKKKEKL